MRLLVVLCLCVTLLACGCVSSPYGLEYVREASGGASRLTRVQAIYDRTLAPQLAQPLRIRVAQSDAFGAYASSRGRITVTAGLVDSVTDDELAAALAHEAGHLLIDGHCRGVQTLAGAGPAPVEVRADAAAVELLGRAGVHANALRSLLTKLKAYTPSPAVQAGIDARLDALAP